MNKIDLLKALLFESVAKLYANDYYLFTVRGMENACVSRIIYYMQDMLYTDQRFAEWRNHNIDFEYNKSTDGLKVGFYYKKKYLKPDLVLHIRGTDKHNLMVVEFKKGCKSSDSDITKLRDLTHSYQRYKYVLGCAVSLKKQKVEYRFVQKGKEVESLFIQEYIM
ncbi:MAG: hypothetical protein K2M34_04180 [Alphaproteobacteria bacterium]|nr:hypothetical protein [Alphaproteobacteria bacterium]